MTQKTGRKHIPLLILGAVLSAFALLLGVRYKEANEARKALQEKQVQAATAPSEKLTSQQSPQQTVSGESTRWQPRISLTGTVVPARDAALSFKGVGRLIAVRVKVGDRVKEGQLIAELDSREVRAQLVVAHAQVNTAEVQYQFAQENEQRSRNLYASKAVSESNWTADHQRSELARVQLEAARAQIELARTALANTELIAPFAGTVIEAPNAPGAIVAPGAVLFRIQDTSSLTLNATLSPADAALARLGERVEITDGPTTYVGRITAILPAVDTKTRRVPITAEMPNNDKTPLLANLFVRATLVPSAPIDVLKLPATAIRSGSRDEVAVVDNGSLRIVHIAYARDNDGSLLVRSGLSARDRVVAAPGGETLPEVTP